MIHNVPQSYDELCEITLWIGPSWHQAISLMDIGDPTIFAVGLGNEQIFQQLTVLLQISMEEWLAQWGLYTWLMLFVVANLTGTYWIPQKRCEKIPLQLVSVDLWDLYRILQCGETEDVSMCWGPPTAWHPNGFSNSLASKSESPGVKNWQLHPRGPGQRPNSRVAP